MKKVTKTICIRVHCPRGEFLYSTKGHLRAKMALKGLFFGDEFYSHWKYQHQLSESEFSWKLLNVFTQIDGKHFTKFLIQWKLYFWLITVPVHPSYLKSKPFHREKKKIGSSSFRFSNIARGLHRETSSNIFKLNVITMWNLTVLICIISQHLPENKQNEKKNQNRMKYDVSLWLPLNQESGGGLEE